MLFAPAFCFLLVTLMCIIGHWKQSKDSMWMVQAKRSRYPFTTIFCFSFKLTKCVSLYRESGSTRILKYIPPAYAHYFFLQTLRVKYINFWRDFLTIPSMHIFSSPLLFYLKKESLWMTSFSSPELETGKRNAGISKRKFSCNILDILLIAGFIISFQGKCWHLYHLNPF